MEKTWKQDFFERLVSFSVAVMKLANQLPKTPVGFAVAGQLIRAATSIGANFQEAQDASSTKDFLHKLSIILREAKETQYWLRLCSESQLLVSVGFAHVTKEADQIVAILTSCVKTMKAKI